MTIAPQRPHGKPLGIETVSFGLIPYIMHQALQARNDAQRAEEAQREAEARVDEQLHLPGPIFSSPSMGIGISVSRKYLAARDSDP